MLKAFNSFILDKSPHTVYCQSMTNIQLAYLIGAVLFFVDDSGCLPWTIWIGTTIVVLVT